MSRRVAAAERLLRAQGLDGAQVRVAGHRREIAAVEAPPARIARLTELAPRLKALGFDYVTLDLSAKEREKI